MSENGGGNGAGGANLEWHRVLVAKDLAPASRWSRSPVWQSASARR